MFIFSSMISISNFIMNNNWICARTQKGTKKIYSDINKYENIHWHLLFMTKPLRLPIPELIWI